MREGITVEVGAVARARLAAIVADRNRGQKPTGRAAPQALQGASLAGAASPLRLSLHPILGLLAQCGQRPVRQAQPALLKRGAFCSVCDLQTAINHSLKKTNDDPKPFIWSADPGKIIAAVRGGYRAFDSMH
jgi:hypothetical protein